jgi:hypothetical protein
MKMFKYIVICFILIMRTLLFAQQMTWTQATPNAGWSARYSHTSVVLDNKMWVMGGRRWQS